MKLAGNEFLNFGKKNAYNRIAYCFSLEKYLMWNAFVIR